MTTTRWLARTLVAVAVVAGVLTAGTSGADIGLIVLEPVGPLGFFTRVGHAATYLSNICPDDSPVKMRLCRPGERGGVVSKYAPLSEHEDYDWAIVPFEAYLHGFESAELAPIVAMPSLQRAIERYDFDRLFAEALDVTTTGELPDGQWRATLANRINRSLYVFAIETTFDEDTAIVAAFNAASNRSRFNFFYRNCSNQTKALFDLVRPGTIGDRVGGLTMETPKGLAKALVGYTMAHPDVQLRVSRYPQLPGTAHRSREVLFPLENTYKSIGFAPYWFFGGFREVALGAMVYHEVVSPFSLAGSLRAFATPAAGRLVREQQRLRQQQDDNRRALARALGTGRDWAGLAASNVRINRRLDEIRDAHRAEVQRTAGTPAQWRSRRREFGAMVRMFSRAGTLPAELDDVFRQFEPDGRLSARVLRYLDAHGAVSIGELGPGPWLTVTRRDGQRAATGLSRAEILSGDRDLAVLILSAAIDDHLHRPPHRRGDIGDVTVLLQLFSEAVDDEHTRVPAAPVQNRTLPSS